MDHFVQVYRHQAAAYLRVLDLGSGTGRIPLLLRALDCDVVSVDLHQAMLVEQREHLGLGTGDWRLVQADLRELPLRPGWADVVSAGWAIGHFIGWYPDDWRNQVDRALAAMQRAAKPGGTLIILETLGTGRRQPGPPSEGLAAYYAYLEEQGFARREISTDYQFASVYEAVDLGRFFFGDELAARVQARGQPRVPEFTGIWSRDNSPR